MSKEREHCEAAATGFQRDRMLRQGSGSLADLIARERAARWNEALEAAASYHDANAQQCFDGAQVLRGLRQFAKASQMDTMRIIHDNARRFIRALKEPA